MSIHALIVKCSEDKGAEDKGAGDKGAEDKGAEDKGAEDKGAEDKGAENFFLHVAPASLRTCYSLVSGSRPLPGEANILRHSLQLTASLI
jgi:hypothetical protein